LREAVFCGYTENKAENKAGQKVDHAEQLEIPAADYFFAQQREALDRETIISMAIEVQREILWQRLQPEPALYLRRLFEDGSQVTQIFRRYSGERSRGDTE
jgi:hypothetical protein